MIDFAVDDDVQILLDAVTRFARQHLAPGARDAESNRGLAETVVRLYEEMGLSALEAPGGGLGMTARCLVNEILGRADPGTALAHPHRSP